MKISYLALTSLLLASAPVISHAQVVTTMINSDGVGLPCVTVGPLVLVVQEYCVRRTEAEGFISKRDVGGSGLTIGVAGGSDGAITALAPGSPAATAGLTVGDRLVSIDGHQVRRPVGEIAEELIFGARGAAVHLSLIRGGQPLQVSYVRAAAPEPAGTPHSPNFLLGIHPMVNWRGQFIPCMGAGLLGPAVVAACLSHYGQDGFVNVAALGSSGLSFDLKRPDIAAVTIVEPDSPASAAGVKPGDVVTQINDHPISASVGKEAHRLLFGRVGETRQVIVDRDGRRVTASITLSVLPTQ